METILRVSLHHSVQLQRLAKSRRRRGKIECEKVLFLHRRARPFENKTANVQLVHLSVQRHHHPSNRQNDRPTTSSTSSSASHFFQFEDCFFLPQFHSLIRSDNNLSHMNRRTGRRNIRFRMFPIHSHAFPESPARRPPPSRNVSRGGMSRFL